MNRKFILFIAIILALSISIANAQTVWDKQTYNQPDSADLLPNSGRIILNGRLLEPPYVIASDGHTIRINGEDIYKKPEQTQVPIDTSLKEQVMVINNLFDYFNGWYFEFGFDSAKQLVVDYLQKQPVVDSVYYDDNTILKVQFQTQIWPETILLEAPDDMQETAEQRTKDFLDRQAIHLKDCISGGKLLVITDGVIEYTNNCHKLISNIKNIMALETESDRNKEKKIAELLNNKAAAAAIMNNWNKR